MVILRKGPCDQPHVLKATVFFVDVGLVYHLVALEAVGVHCLDDCVSCSPRG